MSLTLPTITLIEFATQILSLSKQHQDGLLAALEGQRVKIAAVLEQVENEASAGEPL